MKEVHTVLLTIFIYVPVRDKEELIMKIVNCTPHVLNIITDSKVIDLAPSGINPRVSVKSELSESILISGTEVPVYQDTYGELNDLPEQQEGTFLVVSRLVAAAAKGRNDLLVPGALIRNEAGQPIGCKGLARI